MIRTRIQSNVWGPDPSKLLIGTVYCTLSAIVLLTGNPLNRIIVGFYDTEIAVIRRRFHFPIS